MKQRAELALRERGRERKEMLGIKKLSKLTNICCREILSASSENLSPLKFHSEGSEGFSIFKKCF